MLIWADRADLARELTERELAAARREGHRREIYVMQGMLSLAAWQCGDIPAAVAHADAAVRICDPGAHAATGHGFKAHALLDAGDLAAVEEALQETSPEHWSEDERGSFNLYYARAQLRIEQHRLEEAQEDVEVLRDRAKSSPSVRTFEDFWRPLGVTLAHRQGDVERARALGEELLEYSRRFGVGVLGRNLRTVGLVHDGESQMELLRESVELSRPLCYRLEYARSLIELGAALRRRGDRAAAREPLAEGLDLAYRCGAAGVVSRALDELRASGARPRRPVRSGADALTSAETRIAKLAADGHSNREIAQELYVTVKTVEGTLGKAYSKLGISGRGAREALSGALGSLREGS
jgi:DNA-binding CsgD family transcriptional regulator